MAQLVMVEGMPGSGKSTASAFVEDWLVQRGVPVRRYAEGRTDHPVDFEQVAVLTGAQLEQVLADFPDERAELARSAQRRDELWLVRDRERAHWPAPLRERLRALDAYDGDVPTQVHTRVLQDSWRRFTDEVLDEQAVYVVECVFLQNPVCALLARHDRPAAELAAHVRALADVAAPLDPLLVHLDAGDPAPVLAAAAAQRPPEWLDFVIDYHVGQGYGLARGLDGFDGLVEFMRHRREFELALLPILPVRTLRLDVSGRDWSARYAELVAFLETNLTVAAQVEPAAR
ncbi:hypothetical protein [Oryzihumus sp.]|uniref:hypothetical protein n=1 Tax=Oryzihumus sp. TaxID=1968903 RepID=UPI002ED85C61